MKRSRYENLALRVSAAMSLLVHCIDAANPIHTGRFGFGYPLVAECLRKHMNTIWPLLVADSKYTKYPALKMVRQYYGNLRHQDELTQEMVTDRLELAISLGRVIRLCRAPPNGALYEEAVLSFQGGSHTPGLTVTDQDGLINDIDQFGNDKGLGCRLPGCTLHPPTRKHRFVASRTNQPFPWPLSLACF